MAGQYSVHVVGKREAWGGYSLKSAQDFARIGSQTGRARVVKRGRKKVREYKRGKRVWPVTKAQCRGLTAREVPRELRGGSKKRNPTELKPGDRVWGTVEGLYSSRVEGAYSCPASAPGWAVVFVADAERGGRPRKLVVHSVAPADGSLPKNLVQAAKRWAKKVEEGLRRFHESGRHNPRGAPKRNPAPTSRYIYPAEKKFPVGDAEHERRALAYVKAGRATPEQVVSVPDWLARHARDPQVKREAKAAVASWKKKGTGPIAQGLRAIRSRQKTIRRKNPSSLTVLVTPTRKGWDLEPAGAGPYYAYGRKLLLEAAAQAPAGRAAHAVELMAKNGPLVHLQTQKAMEAVARKAPIRPAALGALESGEEIKVRMPMRLWKKLLREETGLRV